MKEIEFVVELAEGWKVWLGVDGDRHLTVHVMHEDAGSEGVIQCDAPPENDIFRFTTKQIEAAYLDSIGAEDEEVSSAEEIADSESVKQSFLVGWDMHTDGGEDCGLVRIVEASCAVTAVNEVLLPNNPIFSVRAGEGHAMEFLLRDADLERATKEADSEFGGRSPVPPLEMRKIREADCTAFPEFNYSQHDGYRVYRSFWYDYDEYHNVWARPFRFLE
jgi:hypothetical protein